MYRYLLISIGAILGANSRYLVGLWAAARFGAGFPYGTLFVNLTGSFVLGFLYTAAGGRLPVSSDVRLLVGVGFIASYTTFSSFAFESMTLFQNGNWPTALLNIGINNLGGLAAVVLGFWLARLIG